MRAHRWGTAKGNGDGHVLPNENGNGNGHSNGSALGTNGNAQPAFLGTCAKHYAARAVGTCDDCGELWCADCIVPTTRKRQPTRCIDCALIAAGVRAPGPRHTGLNNMSRHQKRPTKLF